MSVRRTQKNHLHHPQSRHPFIRSVPPISSGAASAPKSYCTARLTEHDSSPARSLCWIQRACRINPQSNRAIRCEESVLHRPMLL
jgi:hypothetical protein